MEYLEIILQDIPVSLLGSTLRGQLQFDPEDVLSSHFFSAETGETCEYADIGNWDAFLCGAGSSDIFLARLDVGMELWDAVVLISRGASRGDVTIQFGEDQFRLPDAAQAERDLRKLFQRLAEICRTSRPGGIVIGYEPAEDPDMRILEIRGGRSRAFYENISHAPELQALCRVGKMYFRPWEDR